MPRSPEATRVRKYSVDVDTYREILRPLNRQAFLNHGELEDAVLDVFNENLNTFPPGYTYLQFIEWGRQNKWIRGSNHTGGFQIFQIFID